MELSSNTNNYQPINQNQAHSANALQNKTQALPKEDPTLTNKEVYEASQGNAVRNEETEIVLTPQGETNLANVQTQTTNENAATAQATRDEQRANGVDYVAQQSKQSQAEIYLSVATDSKVELGTNGDTASIVESLRDVQKQNNAVEAYATYKENQNTPINNISRGLAG